MISPETRTRLGTPKFFRGLLTFYIVRHLLGVALFLWLASVAWSGGPLFVCILGVLGAGYMGYALHGTRKIYHQYQASVRRQKQEAGK